MPLRISVGYEIERLWVMGIDNEQKQWGVLKLALMRKRGRQGSKSTSKRVN